MTSIVRSWVCLLGLLLALPAWAASWYVDVDAVGLNNGTSWANAWASFDDIGWAGLTAGDTVYISGGTYEDGTVTVGKGGTSFAAPITLKASQEVGHNDMIVLNGRWSVGAYPWIVWDGAKSDTYAVANVTNTPTVTNITNNINWRIVCPIGQEASFVMSGAYARGLTWKWIECTATNDSVLGDDDGLSGFSFKPNSAGDSYSNRVEYCWVHDIGLDGVGWKTGRGVNRSWDDALVVHHTLIQDIGDDAFEISCSDVTVYNSILIGNLHFDHSDTFQTVGEHYRFYNNVIHNFFNSCFRIQFNTADEDDTLGEIQIYGNVLGVQTNWFAGDGTFLATWQRTTNEMGCGVGYPEPGCYITNTYITNFVFVNNTVYRPWASGPAWNIAATNWLTLQYLWCNAFILENNVFWHGTNGGVDCKGALARILYDPEDWVFDYNNVSGSAADMKTIRYDDTTYATAELFNAAAIETYTHNLSTEPSFADATGHNYRLTSTDIGARNKGTNLTVLATLLGNGILTDLDGNTRGADGTWDIGAFEYTEEDTNLLLHLTFEDEWEAATYIEDQSGADRHAYRFGIPLNETNWPARVLSSITPGGAAGASGYCADFLWYWDGWGTYGKSGDYAGVTNASPFTNMTTATIAVWARYHNADRVDPGNTIVDDHSARLLSTGIAQSKVGTWFLGRDTTSFTRMCIITNGAWGYCKLSFPDVTWDGNGDSTNWNHYAVTFDNGDVSIYWNGVLYTNAFATNVAALTIDHYTFNATYYDWIGVGCDTHCGTPPMEDEVFDDYPNHGWFNGVMDDVRIYDTVLTSAEIATLAGYTAPAGTTANRVLRVKTGRAGAIRRP